MNIKYNYEIINVDENARCMEVVYTSDNKKTMHIGARLPYEGETVEDVIRAYAPVSYWADQERPIVLPSKGVSGQIEIISEVAGPNKVTTVTVVAPRLSQPATSSPADGPIYYDNYFLDLFVVESFLLSKNITGKTDYAVTMFNVSTNETLAHLYICKKQSDGVYGVKVLDGNILEWYESNVVINGNTYAYASKDLVTDEVIDKYVFDQRGLVKVAPDTVEPTITRFGDFESLPHTIKPFLSEFEHRDKVSAWSLKPYGLVVEFSYK